MSSDHLPITTTINTKMKFKIIQHRNSYTNYKKAKWEKFKQEIEDTLANSAKPSNVHVSNKILTNAILLADKQHIPKGKIRSRKTLMSKEIRLLIHERDNMRKQNSNDPKIGDLNDKINKEIRQYNSNIWKEKLDENWDHKRNTHIYWNTLAQLQNKKIKQEPNRSIYFNNKEKITPTEKSNAFIKQFVKVDNYSTNKQNRKTDRKIRKLINSEKIKITSSQVFEAIKSSRNNNSTGPDNINIKHLKHLGPLAIDYLKDIYNLAINQNIIPQIWKCAKIIPILKPDKNANEGTSYRPISLLSPIVKILEKLILPMITSNIDNLTYQHGFKAKHSTTTALHKINERICDGLNKKNKIDRTVMVALDMSKAFDTVNIYKLIEKISKTNIPNNIIKFLSNYLKGRQAYTMLNNTTSKTLKLKAGVPQGGVLSPTLFNIYMSDIPTPPDNIQLEIYADDMTTLSSNKDYHVAEQNLQPYLNKIYTWTKENDLNLNANKSTSTLFTNDPSELNTTLSLTIDNVLIPTIKHPKILGLTFDQNLNYGEHIKITKEKANKSINIIKSLTSTKWGKSKETIVNTYKTLTRPVLEYASTIWAPIVSKTNLQKLQTVQNSALRTATGCTKDTNIQHLHEETKILPLKEHLQLHASQLRQKTMLPDHPLNSLHADKTKSRYRKQSIFYNKNYTVNITNKEDHINNDIAENNKKLIHTKIVNDYLQTKSPNKVLGQIAPEINKEEENLNRETRRTLAQLRTNKSPILFHYLNKINPTTYPTPNCPLCKKFRHDTFHLFNCERVACSKTVISLFNDPGYVRSLLARWRCVGGLPE